MSTSFSTRFSALAFFSLALFFSEGTASAAESVCFVQPTNAVPIPCPLDGNNYPYVDIGGSGGLGTLGNNVDSVTPVTTGLGGVDNYNYLYDVVAGKWNRMLSAQDLDGAFNGYPGVVFTGLGLKNLADNDITSPTGLAPADAVAATLTGLYTLNTPLLWNGTTYNRGIDSTYAMNNGGVLPAHATGLPPTLSFGLDTGNLVPTTLNISSNGDAITNATKGVVGVGFTYGYNGTTWDRLRTVSGATGMLQVGLSDGGGNNILHGSGINDNNGGASVLAVTRFDFNGATWDRTRNNMDAAATLITFSARAAGTVNSSDQTNFNGRGVVLVFNVTVDTSCSTVITLQGKDIVSGAYYTLLVGAAVVGTGANVYTVYPGATATANVSASMPVPRTWRVSATLTGVSCAVTGTIGVSTVL